MKTLLRIVLTVLSVVCLLLAGAQTPVRDGVSDLDCAVGHVETAYAGYADKTAGREAEYAALKQRLTRAVENGRDGRDAVAPDVRIPLPLSTMLTDNSDEWVMWVVAELKNTK